MIQLEGEITQTSVPPNKAEVERDVTIWVQQTENEIDLTFSLEEFKKYQFEVGDKLSIKIDKKMDIDAMARDFFKTDFNRLQVSLDIGVQNYIIGKSTYANAVFQGAPEGANPMTIPVDLDDPIVHTQFAIQKISKDNMVFTFTYQKDWAEHKDSDRVDLNVRFGF